MPAASTRPPSWPPSPPHAARSGVAPTICSTPPPTWTSWASRTIRCAGCAVRSRRRRSWTTLALNHMLPLRWQRRPPERRSVHYRSTASSALVASATSQSRKLTAAGPSGTSLGQITQNARSERSVASIGRISSPLAMKSSASRPPHSAMPAPGVPPAAARDSCRTPAHAGAVRR